MFSKDWLECVCQIASYETPEEVENEEEKVFRPGTEEDSPIIDDIENPEHGFDIEKMLKRMKERRRE